MSGDNTKKPAVSKKKSKHYDAFFHTSSKCAGCPYGYMQYCVGICWKEVYKGYVGRHKQKER